MKEFFNDHRGVGDTYDGDLLESEALLLLREESGLALLGVTGPFIVLEGRLITLIDSISIPP